MPASADQSAPALVVRTRRIPDPGDLVAIIPPDVDSADVLSWLRDGEGFVGWGRAAYLETSATSRFADADAWWSDLVGRAVVRSEVEVPGAGLVAFGSFAFAADSASPSTLIVPRVIVGRRGGLAWVTTISGSLEQPPSPREQPIAVRPANLQTRPGALDEDGWAQAIGVAVQRISAGDLDKVVMARDVFITGQEPLDARWLLERLSTSYRKTWTFSVDRLIGATPEMLVRREKALVTSRILAGTIQRTGDDEHDLALAASLARSSKDLEEHEYAVRSVAEALDAHCSSMNVPEAPFVLHLPNVMHLATDVAGVLSDSSSSLALAAALHPSAAVCGTPTWKAREVIADLEQMDRGRYAGPVGWIDSSGDGEWGIALRCGQIQGDPATIRLFAGCGIVAGSDPQDEVAESNAKLRPMLSALHD
ncbi:isochorismate synthase [Branchiibius hedensis]|uniref:isochorismate synthase n=1 Tax=Branchiibius hedensis TaxID=672460 RepID=A0A2Y8ZKF7_9MICO|nr:isochorismate synthase [Branchiibius hedensis]PWJ24073.1 isochorismate synthase [Branchiibius hedensis]SSA32891.1 isochorismate synthase [Branchiibius hedensis]